MTQHLALPLRVGADGSLATLRQDSALEVAQSVAVLVSTRSGERLSVPGYGTAEPLFGGVSPDVLTAAVSTWEPRADPTDVQVDGAGTDELRVVLVGGDA